GHASAEIEGEVHVGYASMYEFRFVDFGNDLVEAGLDLKTSYWGLDFSAGAWYGSVTDSNYDFNELDLYAGVSKTFAEKYTIEGGYIYYNYQNVAPGVQNTQEVYVGAKAEIYWGITAGARFYWDFDANNGYYFQPEITKSFSFVENCLSLDLATGIGYADGLASQIAAHSGGTKDGYQGFYVSAALPWKFRDNATLTPYVRLTDAHNDLATGVNDSGQNFVVGGVKVALSF
ncbi:MAG: hypothetical protein JWO82_1971, partial [Akkermansiaceae bacterium]|nr:hypothetical protein [Akkermansiaceae bacterium]